MAFIVLAKVVVLVHFVFLTFVFLGALLIASHSWLVWIHGPCVGYAILITIIGWPCPLTVLEKSLLANGSAPIYAGEFLSHYVWSRFGLTGTELPVAVGLIVSLLAANALPYRALIRSALA